MEETSCRLWTPSCRPRLFTAPFASPDGSYKYYIGCENANTNPESHYFSQPITRDGQVDLNLLKMRCDREIQASIEQCGSIESTRQHMRKCGMWKTRYPADVY